MIKSAVKRLFLIEKALLLAAESYISGQ